MGVVRTMVLDNFQRLSSFVFGPTVLAVGAGGLFRHFSLDFLSP